LCACAAQAEAVLVTLLNHWCAVLERCKHAWDYIESVIEKQLVAAIGKVRNGAAGWRDRVVTCRRTCEQVLTARDFDEYMKYHARRLFKAPFAPRVSV
jgi:hypothetical protein